MAGRSGYDPSYGARPLKRVIQKSVQDPLAERILAGTTRDGDVVTVSANKEGLMINGDVVEASGPDQGRSVAGRVVNFPQGIVELKIIKAGLASRLFLSRARRAHIRHADHGIACDQRSQFILAHSLRAGRLARDDQVAHVGGRIVNANLDVVRQMRAEFCKHGARFADDTRTISPALVPGRRKPQQFARIARAQGADHNVVDVFVVLDGDELCGGIG